MLLARLLEFRIILLYLYAVHYLIDIMLNFTEYNPRSEMFSSWLEGISPLFISNCYQIMFSYPRKIVKNI